MLVDRFNVRHVVAIFLSVTATIAASACGSTIVLDDDDGPGGGCPGGDIECEGACVDPREPAHCGSCDNVCPFEFSCFQGQCFDTCPVGTQECEPGVCVDTTSDPDHCGFCNTPCPGDQTCSAGVCQGDTCDPPNILCPGDVCSDPINDPQNCGFCGNVCPSGAPACISGQCLPGCPPELTQCGDLCVDTINDPGHCGFCFNQCFDSACIGGQCEGGCGDDTCGLCSFIDLGSQVPQSFFNSTVGAPDNVAPPCTFSGSPEVAHIFTAPQDGLYQFDTFGSNFDTVLFVEDPLCNVHGCNDDTIDLDSAVQTLLATGQEVWVVVDGLDFGGDYLLNVSLVDGEECPFPLSLCDGQCVDTDFDPNHCGFCFNQCGASETCDFGSCECFSGDVCGTCSPFIDLGSASPQSIAGSTFGMPDELAPGCVGANSSEAVFAFTAPSSGQFIFDTIGSGYDTVLTVLDASACFELGCNDDFNGFTSRVVTNLSFGQMVFVVVDGFSDGDFVLNVNGGAVTPNCPTVNLGSTLPVTQSGSTVGQVNHFSPTCTPGSAPDVTYQFTAPVTKTYTMDTFGSTYDTVLHVLGGVCTGSTLACNDDSFGLQSQLSVPLTAGQVVTIVVDGFGSGSGSYVLHVN